MLKISYYKLEQRSYSKYRNGVETFYTYDPQRRRLQNLAVTSSAGTIMDNAYRYDAVSNVLSIANAAPLPQSGKAGGQMSHTYGYDVLYRLTSASGTYRGAEGKSASYTLAMSYDNMHRIKSKSQHLTQQGVQFDGTLNAGYDLTYTYQDSLGHKFQLSKIEDLNYRTEGTPNEKIDNGHRYLYDANGNLVYINTSRVKKDGKEDEQATEKKYRWDEENRLLASDENGFVASYWYDADGERTVKSSGEGEQIYVNSEFSGGVTNTAKFSLYVSPYLVASQGGSYTKHIYIGSQRIVSKLGDLASYGADPRRIPYAGTEADGISVDYQTKYNRQQQAIRDNYADFGVPYNGEDNNDYVNGQGFCCNDNSPDAARARMVKARAINGNFKPNDDYEKLQFYYHPDHLGISNYITNLDGEVVQHIEYVPFGEVFIEERNNTWNTPYLFNAKEYDEETGMYYYGARYYEPRISLWMSTDPLQEKDPNISSFCYTSNNPIKYIDPNGKSMREYDTNGNVISDLGGDQIDFIHQKNGDVKIVNKENGHTNTISNGRKFMYRYTHRNSSVSWKDITTEFINEEGPKKSLFSDFSESKKGVFSSLSKFNSVYGLAARSDVLKSNKIKNSVKVTTLYANPLTAGFDVWEQMIGEANISWYDLGNKVLFMMIDSKSNTSLFYHLPFIKNKERGESGFGYGNTYQTYMWTESKSSIQKSIDLYWEYLQIQTRANMIP